MLNETVKILLIILSLGINYPILRELNLELSKLLLVIVDVGQSKTVLNILAPDDATRVDEIMNIKKLGEIVTNVNSGFVAYSYFHSRRGRDFLNVLGAVAQSGRIMGEKSSAMPIVISEEMPTGCNTQDFFTICLNDGVGDIEVDHMLVIPPDDQLGVVFDKIRTIIRGEYPQDKKALLAAACFLYPNMVENELESEFSEVLECAQKLVEIDDNSHDMNNMGAAFIKAMYQWQEQEGFYDVYELPNLDMNTQSKLGQVILFDEEYIYMKESLFNIIAEPLLKICSVSALKTALVEADILRPERTNTYTIKVGYYNLIGQYQRERMLRLRRSKISILGELEFVEICMDLKEG